MDLAVNSFTVLTIEVELALTCGAISGGGERERE